jgi:hypothetical protein
MREEQRSKSPKLNKNNQTSHKEVFLFQKGGEKTMSKEKISVTHTNPVTAIGPDGTVTQIRIRADINGHQVAAIAKKGDGSYKSVRTHCPGCGQLVCTTKVCMGC